MAVFNPVPDAHIREALETGWAAVAANPTLVNDVLKGYDEEILAKAREMAGERRPLVHLGFPKIGAVPCGIAVVGGSDDENTQYLNEGGLDELDDEGELVTIYRDRPRGVTTLYVYVDHADVCLWWYRVTKRVMNVARRFLRSRGLYQVRLSGAEIAPQPGLRPSEIFLRRLSVSYDYEERWTEGDELWAAFYGGPSEERGTMPPIIRHEDSNGGVHPFSPLEP